MDEDIIVFGFNNLSYIYCIQGAKVLVGPHPMVTRVPLSRSRERERGIKLIFLLPSCLIMTRTIIGFNGRLV